MVCGCDTPQVIDTAKFPSMKAMTDLAHSLNLTAGWYGNNCDCHDHCSSIECFAGDVNATLAFGFDSIKLGTLMAVMMSCHTEYSE